MVKLQVGGRNKYFVLQRSNMRSDEQRCQEKSAAVCHYTIFAKLEMVGGDRYRMFDAFRQGATTHFCFSAIELTQHGA